MGGCTITQIGKNVEDLLETMKKQVLAAAKSGLWVDSALVLIDPENEESRLYRVEYSPLLTEVVLTEVPKGRAFHVGVASRYGPHPEKGQMVATVHVHS